MRGGFAKKKRGKKPKERRRAWQTQASDRAGGRHQGRRRKEEQADKAEQTGTERERPWRVTTRPASHRPGSWWSS